MSESDRLGESTPNELGLEAGKNALNPLEEFSKAFGDAFDQASRKQFLDSYLEGVTQFFEDHGLVMPIGSHMENILQPQGLSGFIKGLNREKPNPKEKLDPPWGEYTDPKIWEYTLDMISQHFYGEGYFLGFMIGLAKDYDLNLHQVEVPKDSAQFELFNKGLNGVPRVYTPLIGANFALEGDQKIAIRLEDWIYEGGLKLWLHKQGLNVELACKISHTEALKAFKLALVGKQEEVECVEDSPQNIGFLLGQTAREQLSR